MRQQPGRVFYVMGASGVGKDTLIDAVRSCRPVGVHVACRYTTRQPDRPSPMEVGLAETDFDHLEAADRFWFCWSAHGMRYAIRRREADRRAAGWHVIVNGSRRYLDLAYRRCPDLVPVRVACPAEDVLRERLIRRGRENAAQIEARIARGHQWTRPPHDFAVVDNGGELAVAVEQFLGILIGA